MQKEYKSDQRKVLHYLHDNLIGPRDGEYEKLENVNPVDLYLMGMIHPVEGSDEEVTPDSSEDREEIVYQKKPASLGLSFYIEGDGHFEMNISCAQYIETDIIDSEKLKSLIAKVKKSEDEQSEGTLKELNRILDEITKDELANSKHIDQIIQIDNLLGDSSKKKNYIKKVWQRTPYKISQNISRSNKNMDNPKFFNDKVRVNILWRPYNEGFLVTVTMINNIKKANNYIEEQLFQSNIEIIANSSRILPYPADYNLSYDEEEEELALRYRNEKTYAIGHACAVKWNIENKLVTSIKTQFLPSVNVKDVTTELEEDIDDTVLKLQFLSDDSLEENTLKPLLIDFIKEYEIWAQGEYKKDVPDKSKEAKKRILLNINEAIIRMKRGVNTITQDKTVFDAFKLANLAMLMQMIHGSKSFSKIKDKDAEEYKRPVYTSEKYSDYAWRPFQLAFLLLTIESIVNKESEDRKLVDLIWFPTGGGKTEAYLVISAFELFYRRMKYGEKGAGTAVIKRYTLRLLTAQQFQRASALICACELIRKKNVKLLGTKSYSIGLWVGNASSPNKFSSNTVGREGAFQLYEKTLNDQIPENPFQVEKCPWCGTRIIPRTQRKDPKHYGIKADPGSFSFFCPTSSCEFHDYLPLNVVDEALYDNPPSFLIGTIDKFATLAWNHRPSRFFGVEGTLPPSLIIQDELHLISGPLGTVAGIYEAAIDTILKKLGARPKIIAATATIRRAHDQIEKLFALKANIFPPVGIDADNSYFARVDPKNVGRLYIGVMGQSSTQTTSIVNVGTVLAEAPATIKLLPETKDAYWTQVIYHNSNKELGKTITMSSDDIPNRIKFITKDEDKMRNNLNVVELSGNKKGNELTSILEQMKLTIDKEPDDVIDILPCTNIISVGVDVSRLGLMMMHGQPKTTSEYIQASSRVGRGEVPGIVVMVYPSSNPRNRSHYESFLPYHRALYRHVEPTSVTPYAAPARDRALHAALVIVMRHANNLGENRDACRFDPNKPITKDLINMLIERMQSADDTEKDGIQFDMELKISDWVSKINEHREKLFYDNSKIGTNYRTLLSSFQDSIPEGWPTLTSMRGVDAEIEIIIDGEKL